MSFWTIFVKGFSGLGVASTVPLSFAFHNDTINLESWTSLVPPPAVTEPKDQSTQPVAQMAQVLKKELGTAKDIGCFTVIGKKMTLTRPALYVCTDLGSEQPVAFWFHYNWSNRPKTEQRVNQVKSISYQSSRSVTMQFKEGGEGKLTLLIEIPDWLSDWKSREFNPKASCSFSKDSSNNSYTLSCPSTGQNSFTQTIKSTDFHRPKTLSLT